jgi:hypothetical protein
MFPEMTEDVMNIQNRKPKNEKKKKKGNSKSKSHKKKDPNPQRQNSASGSFAIGLHSPDDPDFQGCRHPA